eukprot:COSAG01_NODE_23440_length_815_cov_1.107542_1_plen_43_part_10
MESFFKDPAPPETYPALHPLALLDARQRAPHAGAGHLTGDRGP